jgi:hypothetical protein
MKKTRRKSFVGFFAARRLVRKLKIKGYNYWKNNKIVYKFVLQNDIPVNPCDYYGKRKCWTSWTDFLGTKNTIGRQRQYKVNHNFFKKWSHNMAYVLGLWFADGCIYNNIFNISLQEKDRYLLEDILNAMQSNYRLRKTMNNYCFEITSPTIIKDIEKLGGCKRKSLIVKFPHIAKKYLPDFVRGYWDGDGTIHTHNKKRGISTYYISGCVSGSKKFIYGLNVVLKSNIPNIRPAIRMENRNGNIYYRIEMGYNDTRRLRDFMYQNNPKLKMLRKYDLFQRAGKIRL